MSVGRRCESCLSDLFKPREGHFSKQAEYSFAVNSGGAPLVTSIATTMSLVTAGLRVCPYFFFPRFAAAFIADFTAGGSPVVSVSGSATVPRQRARLFMPW